MKEKREILSDYHKPWTNIHLQRHNHSLFTNFERESSYLIAQDAINCGAVRRYAEPFVDVEQWMLNNCKFCKHSTDNADHIFNGKCTVIWSIWQKCKSLYWTTTQQKLCISSKVILNNDVKDGKNNYMALKLVVLTKNIILYEKRLLDKYKTFIENKALFINKVFQKIKHQYMFALRNNAVLVRGASSSFWELLPT